MIISRIDFLHRASVDQRTLEVWIEEEWIVPTGDPVGTVFSEVDIARAALIRELKQDMGVNDEGVGLILALLDQVHGLRKALAQTLAAARRISKPDPAAPGE